MTQQIEAKADSALPPPEKTKPSQWILLNDVPLSKSLQNLSRPGRCSLFVQTVRITPADDGPSPVPPVKVAPHLDHGTPAEQCEAGKKVMAGEVIQVPRQETKRMSVT